MKKQFSGVITALITPFRSGEIDMESFERLVRQQLQGGVQGFVINGTTAESPTLTEAECEKLFYAAKKLVPEKFPLIVGTGSNNTQKTIELSKKAERWGADAVLLVVPYYNKPPQRGLFEHFKAVASAIQIPSILYNVPGRTITSLELETIKKLSEHPNIIGIKEASGNIEFAKQIRRACGEGFTLLSGDDATYDAFMAAGGDGCISVAAHVVPESLLKTQASKHKELIDLLFVEANPIPVKKVMQLMGVIQSAEVRLPLVEASEETTNKLKSILQREGLLK